MRCNDCGKEYEAPLPEGVSSKRYDETADAQEVRASHLEGWVHFLGRLHGAVQAG